MGLPKPIKRYTPQEYYELERAADYKSDYYEGEIFAMSGGTARHSLISGNIVREVGNRLKGKPCTAYESNLRLKVKATGLRTYPDATVYCQTLEYDPDDSQVETATNPTVLFEVLSPSTEAYDRGVKAENYRQIETLRAYALVSQQSPHVELCERQADGVWTIRDVRGLDSILAIRAIDVSLPLAEIYDRVSFETAQSDGDARAG